MYHDDRLEKDYGSARSGRGPDSDRPSRSSYRPRDGGQGAGGGRDTERDPASTVFVNNLPFRTSWQDLKDHMRRVGDVEYVKILEDYNGKSRGCGIVQYHTREDAADAVSRLDGSDLSGRQIGVRLDRKAEGGGGGGGGGRYEGGGDRQGGSRHESSSRRDRDDRYGGGGRSDDRGPSRSRRRSPQGRDGGREGGRSSRQDISAQDLDADMDQYKEEAKKSAAKEDDEAMVAE
ncbi:hypothetical protein WJX84_000057 [Apatococcus fuscideae]|uniref:RRM domain-containing protein n=1 Tax=Apatococcus fuscideae TaxID=2026836 RepID=A0AAW1T6N9_9CHLO